MAKKSKRADGRSKRRAWTNQHVKELKDHSRAKTPVAKISKLDDRIAVVGREWSPIRGLLARHWGSLELPVERTRLLRLRFNRRPAWLAAL